MVKQIRKKVMAMLVTLAMVMTLMPAVTPPAKAQTVSLVQDASRSDSTDLGKAILTSDMHYYTNNEGSGSIIVNYVGNCAAEAPKMESSLKFTLPATSSILSSAKLHLPVVDVKNSPTATVTLTDDNSWGQTDNIDTSIYPSLANAKTLLSGQQITSSGVVSLSLDTTKLADKISSSEPTNVTLIVTGSTTTDNYFNFVADDDASSDQASLVLTFKPQVQSVSVPSNGTYRIGDALNFTVSFDSTVVVTGTPRIPVTLNTGGTVIASYVSGSNSKNLVFSYTVSSGELDADGITLGSAISLNGGTIKSLGDDDAELNLYSVAATTSVLVDGVAPTISSVSPPVDATYNIGGNLDYSVHFSEAVNVVATGGSPYLTLTVGSSTVHAAYLSGTGGSALTFRYTVASGDTDADGVALSSNISLNGGTIKDAAGNSANVSFAGSTAAGVVVSSGPTVTTSDVTTYTATTATMGGNVTADGGASVTDRGVVYSSTDATPTIGEAGVTQDENGTGTGSFSESVGGLSPGKTYFVRAYATNSVGTSYGSVTSFATAALTITSATYNASTGVLVVTGSGMTMGDTIAVNKLTLIGEGGSAYTLTSDNVTANSATNFSVTLNDTDRAAVNQILNKNGTSSTSGTTYNLAAADDWYSNVAAGDTSDTAGNGITVSNVALPTITSATYDASTGVLVVTGTGFLKRSGAANDINVLKLELKGESEDVHTLTTTNVEITSGTAFTVTLNDNDKAAINQILNKNGTSSTGGTPYNLAAAEDWAAGADSAVAVADMTGNGITVSNVAVPTITSATYNAATGVLVVTGTGLLKRNGADIVSNRFTLTGEGGATYTLTNNTPNVDITSGTLFMITLCATDKAAVNLILNKNGTLSTGGTTYNLEAAEDWAAGADSAVVVADTTGNGIAVSNVAVPTITSATYDASTGVLVVTGAGLLPLSGASNDIVANKFTLTGEGGATYTLTDTPNVDITNGTSFTLTLSATDKAGVNLKLNKNGTNSVDVTTYNLAAAEDWAAGADSAVAVADISGNGISVSKVVPKVTITSMTPNPTNSSPFSVTITFTESVSDFELADITVINGAASNLSGGGTTYTADITPADQGVVTVNVAAEVAHDLAGIGNTAATELSRTYDNTPPAVGAVSNGGLYNLTVSPTFTEGSATLAKDGGAPGEYTSGTAIVAEGSYVLVVTDAMGNSTTISFTIDKTPPAVGGVSNNGKYKESVVGTFTEGTATLAKDGGAANAYLSGAAISNEGSYVLVVTDTAGNSNTINFVIDTTPPTVTGVSSSTIDGSYKAGDTVSISVSFSESVIVTGTPQLTLETGTIDRTIDYTSGSGSNTLNFTYTVQAGDTASDLDYAATGALSGTIKDAAGNDAIRTLAALGSAGSLGASKAIVIDTTNPTVSSVSVPISKKYKVDDILSFTVNFSEAVTVTGAPTLAITLDTGGTVNAAYASGNNTTAIVFTYTIVSGNADGNGIAVGALSLNLGTIKDAAGNNATLTLNSVGSTAGVLVDTTAPSAGGTGTIVVSELTFNSAKLTWTTATDPGTLAANLQYKAVYSTSNIMTVLAADALSGTWTSNITTLTVTGLTANTDYFFNVLVKDEAGNMALYSSATGKTTAAPVYDSPSTPTPPQSAYVEVNGEKQDAGQSNTQTTGGTTTTTITVDDTKLDKILEQKGNNATVTLPASGNPDVVVGQLTGQTIKNMETKEAVLEIKTETVTYTLPASQINIDAVSSQLGAQVELKDIKVNVKIAEPPADTVKIVENTASKGNYQLVVKPVEFEIICTSGDTTVEVSRFNGYVERTIAIPDGIDPSKITTGIVLNSDGTFSHVPTSIVQINGKYFAKINSLTNSTYSVIYNPVTFTDVANHWAKNAVNDMGSRMVVTGIGDGIYEPERSITRAEFAAIVVRAMGLKKGTTESAFGDVTLTDWFNGYVDTATAYSLITGYSSESFAPNDTITREQAMTILARAMKFTGLSVTLTDSEASALLANYTDAGLISDYAKAGAAECINTGVVSGTTASTLSPKDSVTRAEVAAMVQRLLQKSGLI